MESGNGFEISEDWINLAPIKGSQYIGLPGEETDDPASPFALGQFKDQGTSLVLGGSSLSQPLVPPNLPGLILTVGENGGPSWATYTGYSAPRPILMPPDAFSDPTGAFSFNTLDSFIGMLTPELVGSMDERPQWGFRFSFRAVARKHDETQAHVAVELGPYIPPGTSAVPNTGLVCGEATLLTNTKRYSVAHVEIHGSELSISIIPFVRGQKIVSGDVLEVVMTGSVQLEIS